MISGALTARCHPTCALRPAKPIAFGKKTHDTVLSNSKRKVLFGAPASGQVIARWDANTKEHFTGSGLARMMNTSGFCAEFEL